MTSIFLGHGILVMLIFPQFTLVKSRPTPKKKRPNEVFVKFFLLQIFAVRVLIIGGLTKCCKSILFCLQLCSYTPETERDNGKQPLKDVSPTKNR